MYLNLRWYDTLEILLSVKHHIVHEEKKVNKDEKNNVNRLINATSLLKWNTCTTICKYLEKMSTIWIESDDC